MTVEERLAVLEHQLRLITRVACGAITALVALLAVDHFVFIPIEAVKALEEEAGKEALANIQEAKQVADELLAQHEIIADFQSRLGTLEKECVRFESEISLRRDSWRTSGIVGIVSLFVTTSSSDLALVIGIDRALNRPASEALTLSSEGGEQLARARPSTPATPPAWT